MNLIGVLFGFYGYVFPGNINLMILDLYNSKKYSLLSFMLFLIVLFESIYCFLSLSFIENIKSNNTIISLIDFTSYFLILIMGVWMIFENKVNKISKHQNTIFRGVLNIIIHPQQIPYWLIAGNLLNHYFNLNENYLQIIKFAFFNAIGTLLAMFFYMFFGKKFLNYFNLNIFQINKTIGIIYVLVFLYQIF